MKIQHLILLMVLLGMGVVVFAKRENNQGQEIVGIIQTQSHPALDDARQGFMESLGKDVTYIIQNAEGSLAQARTIVESFHQNSNVKAIYAIATPAAMMAAQIEKEKPIFISAVTDPENLKLGIGQKNVCGTSDAIDIQQQVKMMLKVIPKLRQIAILFNPGEANSSIMVKELETELTRKGIGSVRIAVHTEGEVTAAVLLACKEGDALLVPTDNLLVSCMPRVSSLALKQGKAVFACDTPSVSRGALAARGVSYYQCGIETGELARQVLLTGAKPETLSIRTSDIQAIHINMKVLKELNLICPLDLEHIVQIEGDLQ